MTGESNHQPSFTNRLSDASSPYLKQHQHNPVDWYPWCDEAFAKAREQDKPIFLSVGYSSCHWCHVMAHESFEHRDVADILNRHFISIKVDREEHPAVDALYMTATHLLTQHGGWPNSVWLMPDGRPWYAGTYFPREDSPGRVGFKTLLHRLHEAWRERRNDVEEQANQITGAIRKHNDPRSLKQEAAHNLSDLLSIAEAAFVNQFDRQHGGFGGSPKFPPHAGLLFLLARNQTHPADETRSIIEATLDAMARGGIYDQIGGGFHRYSTDERWLLPHFEKMLYDNALLLSACSRASAFFGQPRYRRIIEETAEWLDREMTHPEGGFFAALDADSEGEEGKFYVWSYDEVIDVLGDALGTRFCEVYQIKPGGNFRDEATGRETKLNIPHVLHNVEENTLSEMNGARQALLSARAKRVRPGLDNKIITSWNGLMISALAEAGRALENPAYTERAEKARRFIESHLIRDDTLLRSWCDGTADIEGVLDDYAALILADLELYRSTQEKHHLDQARRWMDVLLLKFCDPETGALFMTPADQRHELLRVREVYDQGSPSGTGLAAKAMARLGEVTGDDELLKRGIHVMTDHQHVMSRAPTGVSTLLEAAHLLNQYTAPTTPNPSPSAQLQIPETMPLRPDGTGSFDISVKLPRQWRLNALAAEENGTALVQISLTTPKAVVTAIERTHLSGSTFRINVALNDLVANNLEGIITYQACSHEACLPPAQVTFAIAVIPDGR